MIQTADFHDDSSSLATRRTVWQRWLSNPWQGFGDWFWRERGWRWWLAAAILCWIWWWGAGTRIPGVNESHYLTKAKHFWDPAWCAGDLFLESSVGHAPFYWICGWPLLWLDLETWAAWGRWLPWALLSWGWLRWGRVAGFSLTASCCSGAVWLVVLEKSHLAGEWVVGGLEGKSWAYACLVHACADLNSGNWRRAWLWTSGAVSFHFLVGAWFSLLLCGLWSWEQWAPGGRWGAPAGGRMWPSLSKGALAVIAVWGLAAVAATATLIGSDHGISSAERVLAAETQVLWRLSHHLYFPAFTARRCGMFLAILSLGWLLESQCRRLAGWSIRWSRMMILSLAIALGGVALSAVVQDNATGRDWAVQALRLYWFRIADFWLATWVTLLLAHSVRALFRRAGSLSRGLLYGSLTLFAVAFFWQGWERWQSPIPAADQASLPDYGTPEKNWQAYQNWLKVCRWIATETPADACFLTPSQQQTFKWYAGRAEVVCWKDMPQDAPSLLEWRRRVEQLITIPRQYPEGLGAFADEQLLEFRQKFGATHLLILQSEWERRTTPSRLRHLYPENPEQRSTYVVLALELVPASAPAATQPTAHVTPVD